MTDTTTAMQVFSGGEREREREEIDTFVAFSSVDRIRQVLSAFWVYRGLEPRKGTRVGEIGRDKCAFTRNCSRYCRGTLGIPIGRAMPGNSCHLLLFLRRSSACD